MPTKNNVLRGKAIKIDTGEISSELRKLTRESRTQALNIAVESLENMIKVIQGKTANRRKIAKSFPSAAWRLGKGTQDNPLEGAKVVSQATRNERDTRRARLIVYVDHRTKGVRPSKSVNLFDILDAGTKTRTATRRFKMPVAASPMFSRYFNAADLANPKKADSAIGTAKLLFYTPKRREKKGGKKSKQRGFPANQIPLFITVSRGDRIMGQKAKDLYKAAAEYTESELLKRGIVSPDQRTKLKLKSGDIKVRVSRGKSFIRK